MKITIKYESSWRNSFLDGSNNEPLPKTSKGVGRSFIGSMTSLKKAENFIPREVTLDTVMGVLNRLIGDQRKLYQSRTQQPYYFEGIEPLVSFVDKTDCISHEMTYIRNITGSTDQNSYTGMVKVSDPVFSSDYTAEFWGVLALDITALCDFIVHGTAVESSLEANPLVLIERLEEINKLKPVENAGDVNAAYLELKGAFEKFNGLNRKEEVLPVSLYCSGLYLQMKRLSQKYDMSTAQTKTGGISGISNNGFTKKDFMNRYTTGDKKKIWGNPYIRKERIKGIGEVTSLMTKASGTLEIELSLERSEARKLEAMINDAGVSSFYLGKKGLAYVSDIRV